MKAVKLTTRAERLALMQITVNHIPASGLAHVNNGGMLNHYPKNNEFLPRPGRGAAPCPQIIRCPRSSVIEAAFTGRMEFSDAIDGLTHERYDHSTLYSVFTPRCQEGRPSVGYDQCTVPLSLEMWSTSKQLAHLLMHASYCSPAGGSLKLNLLS